MIKQFSQGIRYLLSGFQLITQPGIRVYVLLPLLVNTTLFTVVIIYGVNSLDDFINWLTTQLPWFEWLTWLLWPIFLVIALIIVFFSFSILANLIAAPFNGFLAEAVERRLTGGKVITENEQGLIQSMFISVKMELKKLLYFVTRALPLLLLFIVPIVNSVAPLVWLLFGAWVLTIEYTDFPMGNHGIQFAQQRERIAANRSLTFGFGLAVLTITIIPVLNFLAMPVAVAGATKMYLEQNGLNAN